MPIEFSCPKCARQLRTPDDSAGKQARCPQCQAIVDVPAGGPFAGAPFPAASPPPNPNPFAEGPKTAAPWPVESGNPYASPFAKQDFGAAAAGGELRHSIISFDTVTSDAWNLFQPQMGPLALCGLVALGVNIGLQIVSTGGNFAAQVTREPAVIIIVQLVMVTLSVLVQTWLQLSLLQVGLKVARGQPAVVGDMFAMGNAYGRAILLSLCFGAIFLAGVVVFGIPTAVLAINKQVEAAIGCGVLGGVVIASVFVVLVFRWMLCFAFILDRGAGVFESMTLSAHHMRGNKLWTFLILLVVSMAGGMFACVTCYIGLVLVLPFQALTTGIIYLSATGQPYARPRRA